MNYKWMIACFTMVLVGVTMMGTMDTNKDSVLQANLMNQLTEAKLDVDMQAMVVEEMDMQQFTFLENLPMEGYTVEAYAFYGRESMDSDVYDSLLQYEVLYTKGNQSMKLSFSTTQLPLRCYYVSSEKDKVSKIHDVDVIVHQHEDMYLVTFEHDGVYFDIETQQMSEEQLVTILNSILE